MSEEPIFCDLCKRTEFFIFLKHAFLQFKCSNCGKLTTVAMIRDSVKEFSAHWKE